MKNVQHTFPEPKVTYSKCTCSVLPTDQASKDILTTVSRKIKKCRKYSNAKSENVCEFVLGFFLPENVLNCVRIVSDTFYVGQLKQQ